MSGRPIDIRVRCVQRGEGLPDDGKELKLSLRERTLDQRMLLTCANPACRKGGFLFRREIDRAVEAGDPAVAFEKPCAGHVGPVRTERGYADGCPNRLEVEAAITYGRSQ